MEDEYIDFQEMRIDIDDFEVYSKINRDFISQNTLKIQDQETQHTQNIQTSQQQVQAISKGLQQYNAVNFEQYRNNTSFFDKNKHWLKRVKYLYFNSPAKKILQLHQFETVMYMSGKFMSTKQTVFPKGLLLFFFMGTGKTITNIASSFYCLSYLPIYNSKSKVTFICNKALQPQLQQEVIKYVQLLNKQQVNELFDPIEIPLKQQDFLDKCNFITFNDSFSLNDNLVKQIDSIQNGFLVFDEVHNLFKSIINDTSRGKSVYSQLISNKLQIQFNSGTPFSSDLKEFAVCFNLLSGNPNLFPLDSMESLFTQTNPQQNDSTGGDTYIKNKQVLARRVNGLIGSAEINLESGDYPKMRPLQLIQIQIPKEYAEIYQNVRKQNLKSQKFMSESHLLDNAYINSENIIISEKFAAIKKEIEKDIKPQLLYSQFVKNGSILFSDYCLYSNKESDIQWREFSIQTQKRQQNEVVYALIHGLIPAEDRTRIIQIFNSPENVNGDIITLLCLSKASVEGLNIKFIRKVHIMEAQWESRDLQQVMSRGQRLGSHSLLPPDQRFLTPYIYLSYTKDPKFAFIRDIFNMSTDQQIYFKQQSMVQFQNTLFSLLNFTSFNCYSLSQFIYLDQMFKPDFHKACFTCESDNKQLFNPKFVHQDIITNNCKRPQIQTKILKFTHNNIEYGLQLDIYAAFGFNIFELRDKYKKPIQPDSQLFSVLFEKAKELLSNNNSIQQPINVENQQVMFSKQIEQQQKTISIFVQNIIFLQSSFDIQQLGLKSKQIEDADLLIQQLKPSAQVFTIQTLVQFLRFQKIYYFNSYTHQSTKSTQLEQYTLFDLYSLFKDGFNISQSNPKKQLTKFKFTELSKTEFKIDQLQLNHIQFYEQIISPFYRYLIENINVHARNLLEKYFLKYQQLFVVYDKGKIFSQIEKQLLTDLIKYLIQN